MKNTQKMLISLLCLVLCSVLLSCGTGGGGGGSGRADGAAGVWEVTAESDANDGGTSKVTLTIAEEVIDGKTFTTYRFVGETTDVFQYGFANAIFTPDEATLELLKACKAISFKMLNFGEKGYYVEAPISTVTDWGFHRYAISRPKNGEVEEHYIEKRMFMQPPWAQPVRFNTERLTMFRIQTINATEAGPRAFDFKVWDIKLYP